MKKKFSIVIKGCLGFFVLIIIFLGIVLYPIFFPSEVTISDYTDDYKVTANTKHPKFKPLVNKFNQQKHRFEFDICEYKYNSNSFFFGDSPEKIISIFGKPDGKDERTIYNYDKFLRRKDSDTTKKALHYEYKNLKLSISFKKLHNKGYELSSLNIAMSKDDYQLAYKYGKTQTLFDVVLFRKVPYQLNMTLNEFMELSNLSHKKLRRTGGFHRSFFMFQEECPPTEETRIYTGIDSYASYETEGGGHMTWTGNFDPTKSSTIESLSFYLKTLEDY
ncbi:hypothetical protein [Aquimarina pacifica]|uniref:hypothetical protein n=1 Tax=Aquimarina pacifica TaxID=1296415 RepID=UPI00046EA50B|nr:hypothetical protein [Aquimarina pacifica]